MTSYEKDENKALSKIMICSYFNSEITSIISEFVNELPDIIENKKAFSICLTKNYYKINSTKDQIKEYLAFVMQVVNLTEKHFQDITSQVLVSDQKPKIVDTQCNLVKRSAVICFNNNRKIIFRFSPLKDEQIFNSIIRWVNYKVDEGYALYIRKFVSYGSYGFLEYIPTYECDNQELTKYFFRIGQLLALLYVLNCRKFRGGRILKLSKFPVLTDLEELFTTSKRNLDFTPSSKNIAQDIIDSSVYNIDFIPRRNKYLAKLNISPIKSGFQYVYVKIINSKIEFVDFLKSLFDKDSPYLATVITKVYNFNTDDLIRQLYFLDLQFNIKQSYNSAIKFSKDISPNKINVNRYLDLAVKMGNDIIRKSIIGFNNNNTSRIWMNTVKCRDELIISPKCKNLYEGNSGIALFFLYLGVAVKKEYFINIAIEALRDSLSNISSLDVKRSIDIGAFNGICGELYTLSKIYSITKDSNIKKIVKSGLSYVNTAIAKQKDTSFFDGLSGVLAVFLSIYENQNFSDIKDVVLSGAESAYGNILSNIYSTNLMPGFYHGIDGVIAVFIKLLSITGDTAIKNSIGELLKIERSFNTNNKTDLEDVFSGMLISRVLLKQHGFNDSLIDTEISKALNHTIKKGFGNSPYYYNGDIGSLEILEYTAKVLKDEVLRNRCTNTFISFAENAIEPSINDEKKQWSLSMSLMKGMCGYGYIILRNCNENIPNILLLD